MTKEHKNWRDRDALGSGYVSFKEIKTHCLEFTGEGEYDEMEDKDGKKKPRYVFPVIEDGEEKKLGVSSRRLLKELQEYEEERGLIGETIIIKKKGEGYGTFYTLMPAMTEDARPPTSSKIERPTPKAKPKAEPEEEDQDKPEKVVLCDGCSKEIHDGEFLGQKNKKNYCKKCFYDEGTGKIKGKAKVKRTGEKTKPEAEEPGDQTDAS